MKKLPLIILFFMLFPCSGLAGAGTVYGTIRISAGNSEPVNVDQTTQIVATFDGENIPATVSPGECLYTIRVPQRLLGQKFRLKVTYGGRSAELQGSVPLLRDPMKFDLIFDVERGTLLSD